MTRIAIGGELNIQLPENGSTGYLWEIDTGGLTLVTSEYQLLNAAIGGGGTRTFVLRGDATGTYLVQLHLKRAWEADFIKSVVYQVHVGEVE